MCLRVHVCACVCGEVFIDRISVKVWGVCNKKELAGKGWQCYRKGKLAFHSGGISFHSALY